MRKRSLKRLACLAAALLMCLTLIPRAPVLAQEPDASETETPAEEESIPCPAYVDHDDGSRTYLLGKPEEFAWIIRNAWDGPITVYGEEKGGTITVSEDLLLTEGSEIWMPEYDFVIAEGAVFTVEEGAEFRAKNLTVEGTIINRGIISVSGLFEQRVGTGKLEIRGALENDGRIEYLDGDGNILVLGEEPAEYEYVDNAAESEEQGAKYKGEAGEADYTNAETGYAVRIIDELGLLTEAERAALLEDMKPITRYGNVAFWTTEIRASDEIEQARLKRRELFELTSGTIFVINMNIRKLTIQSYGEMYDVVTKARANSITNYVRNYATRGEYYSAAKIAFGQIYDLMRGSRIPEPMKHLSNACIALMAGLIIMLMTVFGFASTFRVPTGKEIIAAGTAAFAMTTVHTAFRGITSRYSPQSDSSSGSSCSSCGGGGGSSCSSCGGGGSSSF